MSYCTFCKDLPADNLHKIYHDYHYGFPIDDDNELFGRFILEINQAGLSWELMLKKQANFREAYAQFDIHKVAQFGPEQINQLLQNPGIIRNKLKINAAIHNARVIVELQEEYGSFKNWIHHHHPMSKEQWVKLFKKTFKFTGGEIVNEFMMSIGILPGAHDDSCPIFHQLNQ